MDQQTKPIVLLTGFGPFFNHPVNASWEVVKSISRAWRHPNIELEIREIPVVYEAVTTMVPELHARLNPTLCVHFGVSPYEAVTLESRGHNHGYCHHDVDDQLPSDGACKPDGPFTIGTCFDLDRLCSRYLETQSDVLVNTSSDAGRYLCDFIYYTSLSVGKAPVLFVHIPPLDKPYSLDQLTASCLRIVELLLEEIDSGSVRLFTGGN